MSLGWDLKESSFEAGKTSFGLTELSQPGSLKRHHKTVSGILSQFAPPEKPSEAIGTPFSPVFLRLKGVSIPPCPELKILAKASLKPPSILAQGDLEGLGNQALLLYDDAGQPRFDFPPFIANPVAMDSEGKGVPDIVLAGPNSVRGFSQSGALLWTQDLPNEPMHLSAGDLDQDGKEELGILMDTWAMVIKRDGRRLIDEDIYKYKGLWGGFGDVDGDGQIEFVAVTSQGSGWGRDIGGIPRGRRHGSGLL
jgi:hypothetical protein